MRLDEELAFKLQAEEEEEEEERLAREKAQQIKEASISWDDVQEKRAGKELEQESSKKQKVEEDKESGELKQCLEIVPDDGDDVTIDATPLSIKSPTIMLKNFDRGDLEVLWSIVKARFKKTEPVNYMDNLLLLNLKTMFEHHVEDNVWKNQQGLVKVLNWKLYDSCGVHCGRIIRIKRLLDVLEVTVAQLMLLVYKLLLLVLKVNAASTKVTTAQRLRLLKEFLLSKKG
ncbi:hypothetical protein Tco_0537404 [Tanacetum coccineum]